jgi:hypothetical protein
MFDLLCQNLGILTIGIVAGLVFHATMTRLFTLRGK